MSLFDEKGAARHGFFLLLASSFVLYIHEIVVRSSLKGIRISRMGVLRITFPSVPRALRLQFEMYIKTSKEHLFFRAFLRSWGTLNNDFTRRNII